MNSKIWHAQWVCKNMPEEERGLWAHQWGNYGVLGWHAATSLFVCVTGVCRPSLRRWLVLIVWSSPPVPPASLMATIVRRAGIARHNNLLLHFATAFYAAAINVIEKKKWVALSWWQQRSPYCIDNAVFENDDKGRKNCFYMALLKLQQWIFLL